MVYMCKIAGFLHKKAAFLQKYLLQKKPDFLHKKAAFLQKYIP